MGDAVRVVASAKVNLCLHVLARETSGYHGLETLFCALSLADEIDVRMESGSGISLRVEGEVDTGPPAANLALRAAQAFLVAAGIERSVDIILRKRIPAGGGLGGGSSNAAAVLRALALLLPDVVDRDVLMRIGGRLGSDVPFFVSESALALAWGRGDRLLSLPPLPSRPVLVAHPGAPMPTARAYEALAEARQDRLAPEACSIDLARLLSWEGVASLAGNDFEATAMAEIPRLVTIRSAMRNGGAGISFLAGSGSSYVGIFEDAESRDSVLSRLRLEGVAVWPADTLERIPPPVDRSGAPE